MHACRSFTADELHTATCRRKLAVNETKSCSFTSEIDQILSISVVNFQTARRSGKNREIFVFLPLRIVEYGVDWIGSRRRSVFKELLQQIASGIDGRGICRRNQTHQTGAGVAVICTHRLIKLFGASYSLFNTDSNNLSPAWANVGRFLPHDPCVRFIGSLGKEQQIIGAETVAILPLI